MSIIFHQLLEATEGRLPLNVSSGPIVGGIQSQGLIINSSGEIESVLNGTIDHYHASMPFDINGRLCVTDSVASYQDQGIPFASNGSIAVIGTGPGDYFNQGLAYKAGQGLTSVNPINPAAPTQVQNLQTAVTTDNEIDVTWDANPAPENVTSYTVEYKPDFADTFIPINVGLATSHTITGLDGGVTYDVRVYATNVTGDGPTSTTAQETVTGVPSAITDLNAGILIIGSNVTWSPPPSSPALTGYDIEYKENTSGTWIAFNGTGLSTDIDIYNLDPVLQDIRVRGKNSTGDGAWATVQMTPTAIGSPRQTEWNEKGVNDNGSVITSITNTGGFGSSSDLTVFVNQAGWTPNSHKGKKCAQHNGSCYIKTASPPTNMGSQASFIWCGIPFFNDNSNRRVWGSSFQTSSLISQQFNTFIEQGGPFVGTAGIDFTNTEWIVYGRFGSGANSYIRVIKNDGATDFSGSGFAGNGLIQPEIIGWDFNQNAGEDFPALYMECTFYDGLLSTAEENALINSIKQKWFIGVPG